jgi:flagellar basal body P-ring formation protein FlgA
MRLAPCFHMSEFRHLIATTLLGSLALPAAAQTLTPPQDLQRAAESFISKRVAATGDTKLHVAAGAVDSRLRLAACSVPLDAFLPVGAQPAARTTVGVRCTAPNWTVYVPVGIESEMNVLVMKRATPRLASLTAADVEPQLRRVPGFPTTYVTDVAMLEGRHLRLAAAPGTALTADLLATNVLIKRGQRVTLLSAAGSIEVRAPGEAMADALPDGRVRVQNLASRRVVEGVAETADSVRVGQ